LDEVHNFSFEGVKASPGRGILTEIIIVRSTYVVRTEYVNGGRAPSQWLLTAVCEEPCIPLRHRVFVHDDKINVTNNIQFHQAVLY
jgi:hypothetical protein